MDYIGFVQYGEMFEYRNKESKSQVKRALSRLRNEGAVELKYEHIVIKDISIIKKYISDSMWTEELAYEEKKIRES